MTRESLERWYLEGEPILVVMPNLTADMVQFLVSGITLAEWVARFGPLAR